MKDDRMKLALHELPNTHQEAKALKITSYYTGKPCMHGHIAKRAAASRHCVECISLHAKEHLTAKTAEGNTRSKLPAKRLARMNKAWRLTVEAGLSIAEVVKAAGVSPNTVSNMRLVRLALLRGEAGKDLNTLSWRAARAAQREASPASVKPRLTANQAVLDYLDQIAALSMKITHAFKETIK